MQNVKEERKGRTSTLKKGYRHRQEKIDHGYGGFPYEDPSHRTRGRKNPVSKKKSLVFKCKECNKSNKMRRAIRTAKLEIA